MESFGVVLVSVYLVMIVAEFGDKTNLIALSLMGKDSNPYRVAFFSTIGIAISTVMSVLIGTFLGVSFPLHYIRYTAAIVFIWLGVASLLENDEEVEEEATDSNAPAVPFYRIIYLIALAELGDKSQIFAITAAASTLPLPVFIGSVLGMGTIMFATAFLGAMFFDKVDPEQLEMLAALLFILAGIWIGVSTYIG